MTIFSVDCVTDVTDVCVTDCSDLNFLNCPTVFNQTTATAQVLLSLVPLFSISSLLLRLVQLGHHSPLLKQ